MKIDSKSLDQGFEAAFNRTKERFGTDAIRFQDPYPRRASRLLKVLESWPTEAHPRFVTLFAELWAVAETARLANGEPRLTEDEIRAFLGLSLNYFNSFKHK